MRSYASLTARKKASGTGSADTIAVGIASLRQRVVENSRIRLRHANLFRDHQRVEMIAQAGTLEADLLQGSKTVGDDPQFDLAFQRIQQGNRTRQWRTDIRHRVQEGIIQRPRTDL